MTDNTLPPMADDELAGQLTPTDVLKLVNEKFDHVTKMCGDNDDQVWLSQMSVIVVHYRSMLEGVGRFLAVAKFANLNDREEALTHYQQLCQRTSNMSKTLDEKLKNL